jgi:hypothetical protein
MKRFIAESRITAPNTVDISSVGSMHIRRFSEHIKTLSSANPGFHSGNRSHYNFCANYNHGFCIANKESNAGCSNGMAKLPLSSIPNDFGDGITIGSSGVILFQW